MFRTILCKTIPATGAPSLFEELRPESCILAQICSHNFWGEQSSAVSRNKITGYVAVSLSIGMIYIEF
jgi:hypothetical protein